MSQSVSQAVKMIGYTVAITLIALAYAPSARAATTWSTVSGCTGWQMSTNYVSGYNIYRLASAKVGMYAYDRADKQWYDFGTDRLANKLGYQGMSSTFMGNGKNLYIGTKTTQSGSSYVYYQYQKGTGSNANGYGVYSYYYTSTYSSNAKPYAQYKYNYSTGLWSQNLGLGWATVNKYMTGKKTSSQMVYDGRFYQLNTNDGQNGLWFYFDGAYSYWSTKDSYLSGTIAMYSTLTNSYIYNYGWYYGISW
jgi:hypothetical protein